MTILEKVKEITADEIGIDKEMVADDSRFIEDLGADSLDAVELIMALEEEFGVDIMDEDAEQMRTVSDVAEYLNGAGVEWEDDG
jgi:acyl carrier protein